VGIGSLLEQLIGPPGGFILLSLLGLVLMRRYQRVGMYLTASGLLLLYVASLPVTARALMAGLEPEHALSEKTLLQENKPPQAIVILSAGRHYNTPEFGGDTPNAFALERIRYGVWLARRTMLPVLVSGGLGDEESPAESEMAKQLIENEYALPVRWVENKSRTTYENAKYSTEILKAEGIDSIYLVTHAFHMKRGLMSFRKFGFSVVPAPTAFNSSGRDAIELRDFLPGARSLNRVAQVFHERVGLLWYRLRY
jgi:uncharacterized SAM-binding protein YcdF (DUF218 family)